MRIRKKNCCGCGACVDICPVKAVHMVQDKEGFFYPKINEELCVGCGQCKKICPLIDSRVEVNENLFFGAKADNERIRYSSSSGGIFSVLAQYVLLQKGIVYGAGYNSNMHVTHMEVNNLDQLEQIRRTKYVQSSMEGIYRRIEERLAEGRWVLFCGTPCQAQALRRFLEKRYEKLIIVDLVCYGAPSPGIWSEYVKYLEQKHDGKMTDFRFRDKRNRDNGQMCSYTIAGKEEVCSLYQDKYCMMYFSDLMLRPCCHQCRFSTINRNSDFTIGDFWGIGHIRPDLDDGMGISMIIVHTDKAKELWDQVKEKMIWFECDKEDVYQPRLVGPTDPAKSRGLFMILYRLLPFSLFMDLIEVVLRIRRRLKF